MILRESIVDGKQYVFHQAEHAETSGELFPYLLDIFYDKDLFNELHETCALHDEGWIETDNNDQKKSLSKQVHFPDMDNDIHSDIWRKSVQILANKENYYGAACLAEHAHSLSDEKKDLQDELIEQRIILLRKAFPKVSPEVRSWKLQRGFTVLQVTDLATLMSCSGWTREFNMPLLDHEARQYDIKMIEIAPWTVQFDPWIFNQDQVELIVQGYAFPVELMKETSPIDWSPYRTKIEMKFVPG